MALPFGFRIIWIGLIFLPNIRSGKYNIFVLFQENKFDKMCGYFGWRCDNRSGQHMVIVYLYSQYQLFILVICSFTITADIFRVNS